MHRVLKICVKDTEIHSPYLGVVIRIIFMVNRSLCLEETTPLLALVVSISWSSNATHLENGKQLQWKKLWKEIENHATIQFFSPVSSLV